MATAKTTTTETTEDEQQRQAERDAYWMVTFEQIDAGAVGCALPACDDFDDGDDDEDW